MKLKDLKLTDQGRKNLWVLLGMILVASGVWAYLVPQSSPLSPWGGMRMMDGTSGLSVDTSYEMMYEMEEMMDSAMPESGAAESTAQERRTSMMGSILDSRKIQRDGYLGIKVSDLDESRASIESIATSLGGYVSGYQEYGTDNNRSISMTVKVPVNQFATAIEMLRDIADDVESASTSSNDVTDQYVDTKARLDNEKAYETQLVAVLDKATTVEDILAVQKEINVVREKIERLEAELDYLAKSTDYSTISLAVSLSPSEVDVNPDEWSGIAVAKEALAQLIILGKQLLTLLIWLAIYSPAIIAVALLFKIVKWSRMKVAKKKGKK